MTPTPPPKSNGPVQFIRVKFDDNLGGSWHGVDGFIAQDACDLIENHWRVKASPVRRGNRRGQLRYYLRAAWREKWGRKWQRFWAARWFWSAGRIGPTPDRYPDDYWRKVVA